MGGGSREMGGYRGWEMGMELGLGLGWAGLGYGRVIMRL